MIEAKTRFQSRVVRATTVGDIAQLYTDFEGIKVDELGKTVPVRNNAIEVLRRQPHGSWKLIMGIQTDVNETEEIQSRRFRRDSRFDLSLIVGVHRKHIRSCLLQS